MNAEILAVIIMMEKNVEVCEFDTLVSLSQAVTSIYARQFSLSTPGSLAYLFHS